jgi:hypothetical protein
LFKEINVQSSELAKQNYKDIVTFSQWGFQKNDGSGGSGFFAKFDVSQKESINIKIKSCHLVDLEEGNTLEQFTARGTI